MVIMLSRTLCGLNILSYFTSKFISFVLFVILYFIRLSSVNSINITSLPSTAYLNSTWIHEYGPSGKPILFRDLGDSKPSFLAGFFFCSCGYNGNGGSFFGVAIASKLADGSFISPKVVWSANRDHPVELGSRLDFTVEGDLVLMDLDGRLAWSSNTSGKSAVGLNLTENGNLVIFDANKSVVWQSFDHPADTLLPGQKLFVGQQLISSGVQNDPTLGTYYTFSMMNAGILASFESNSSPPEPYYQEFFKDSIGGYNELRKGGYLELTKGYFGSSNGDIVWEVPLQQTNSTHYVQLDTDGNLKVHQYQVGKIVEEVYDLLHLTKCDHPMGCGRYGICRNDQCSCPTTIHGLTSTSYFQQKNDEYPDMGCSLINPLTCNALESHALVELAHVGYFSSRSYMKGTTKAYCKEVCLANCSCKVAVFSNDGDCLLSSEVFSLVETYATRAQNVTAFIKVQTHIPSRKNNSRQIVAGVSVGGVFIIAIIIGGTYSVVKKRQNNNRFQNDHSLDQVAGTLSRFSSAELKIATNNFSKKLGQGGFGSVYEGILRDGTKIAVKRLHRIEQSKRSFLAEVESIGSIHHVNLVKLIGFCVDKLHNHLVYVFMPNGSLDRWIYCKNSASGLDWKCKKNIIQDVAKGLAYLHEECRQKIVHLDVKPQNILLDGSMNAKISDFGLAKLIDKSQSKVVTILRGTPGYLSPEWLNGVVTEKVDVYSFGIVLLEILCGRKHFDASEVEEHQHLLSLFKTKVEEGKLSDLVDKRGEEVQSHVNEAIEIMQLAAWCLQTDRTKRPSMSTIVKVLEGVMVVEDNVDHTLLDSHTTAQMELGNGGGLDESAPLPPSILTGPR